MKKLIFIFLFIQFLFFNIVSAKEFKSKNGYKFDLPIDYDVKESLYQGSYMTILFNRDEMDEGKNLMFIMISKDTMATRLLSTYPEVKPGDEFCNLLLQETIEQSVNEDLQYYECTKRTKLNYKNSLKTVYDAEVRDGYLQYQYTFELNNYLMLVSGTCKKINCENRDNKLVILSNSIVW